MTGSRERPGTGVALAARVRAPVRARVRPRTRRRFFARALAVVCVAALVAGAAPALALEITLEASRQEVSIGEQFSVAAVVSHDGMGSLPEPDLASVDGLRRVSTYTQQNFSYVNGRATSSLQVTYVFVADAAGEFTLGPAHVAKGQDTAESGTVAVKVLPAGSSATVPRLGDEAGTSAAEGDDLIVLAEVDDTRPYVNEQITYTFTFLHRTRLMEGGRYTAPSFQGFWAEELDKVSPRPVVLDNKRYTAERIRTALFPTGPGTYTVGSAFVNTVVEERRRGRRRDPFDILGGDRFGLFRSGREIVLQSDSVEIQVRPLPTAGKPDNFAGVVGTFTLESSVDTATLDAGDPVTLTVRLSGTGNLKGVPDPDLSTLDGFRIYESSSNGNTTHRDDRIVGEKVWEFVLVPTSGGDVEIPPVRMGVFDPEQEAYVQLATEPIPLDVSATALDEALAQGGDVQLAKERVRLRQRDIRWVKPANGPLRRASASPFTAPLFLLAHSLPVFAFAASALYRRHRDRLRSDVAYARRRGAARTALKRIQGAKPSLDAGNPEPVFAELSGALRGYVADMLELAAANLDEAEVRRGLGEGGVPPEGVDELFRMLESCDTARFSPIGSDPAAARRLLDEGSAWIRAVEKR